MNDPFIETIKRILNRKRISQNELAEKVGCSRSSMSYYLNGRTQMPLSIGVAIAKELHIDLNHIYDIDTSKIILDEIEEELLNHFRKIPAKNKRIVARSMINLMYSTKDE